MAHSPPNPVPRDFEREVEESLRAVRSAFLELLSAAEAVGGGGSIRRATDLQRFLDLPSTLAWQVFRVAKASQLLAEVEGVPGTKAARKLVHAASEKGIDQETLARLSGSLADFDELVRTHADGRRAFNSIVAGIRDGSVGAEDPNYRKAAFEANCHIWGSLMRTRLASFIAHPATEDRADILALFGYVDYYRLHGHSPLTVSKTKLVHKDNTTIELGRPLVGEITEPGSTILTEFCTQPFPNLQKYVDDEGHLCIEIDPTDVGRQHSITVYAAEVVRAVATRFRLPEDTTFGTNGNVVTPTNTQVVDLIVAPGTFGPTSALQEPQAYMVGNVRGKWIPFDEMATKYKQQILARPEVVHLGKGPRVLETPDVPRYPEIFRHVCTKLGWNADDFDVFRCRVEYPVVPSVIGVGFDLNEISR